MLFTDLKQGQFVQIGDAMVTFSEIKDTSKGLPKVRLKIEAPQSVKIQFDNRKTRSD